MIFHQIASLSCLPGRQEAVSFFFFCLSHRSTRTLEGGLFSSPIRSRTNRGELLLLLLPLSRHVLRTVQSRTRGAWSRFLTSRTEGHVSDIDLTCSRLIVAHLPEDKGCQARCPTLLEFSAHSSARPVQNGGTRLLEVLPLDLYSNVQVGAALGQVVGDYNLELAEFQVSLVFRLYKHTKLNGCVRNGGLT